MPVPIIAAGALGALAVTFVRYLVSHLIVRVVTALGLAFVTFTAIDAIVSKVNQLLSSTVYSADGLFLTFMQAAGIPSAMNMIVSTYVAALGIRAAMGAFNKITFGRNRGT